MAEHAYNPARITLAVVGPIVIPQVIGFVPGSFVQVSRRRERFAMIVGLDGEVTRRRYRDRAGTITIALEAGSPSNPLLQALHTLDDLTQSGIATVFLRDRNGVVDLAIGTQCWISAPPPYQKGSRSGAVQWQFDAARLEIIHGGLSQI